MDTLLYALKRQPKPIDSSIYEQSIHLLGLGKLLNRKPETLSGGERQRVAIARALASRPQLLLMDEPLAGVDAQQRQELLPWLLKLRDALSLPIIYVTHTHEEASAIADTLVLLEHGRLIASGPAEQIWPKIQQGKSAQPAPTLVTPAKP